MFQSLHLQLAVLLYVVLCTKCAVFDVMYIESIDLPALFLAGKGIFTCQLVMCLPMCAISVGTLGLCSLQTGVSLATTSNITQQQLPPLATGG